MDSEVTNSFNSYLWNPLRANEYPLQGKFRKFGGSEVVGITLGTFDGIHLGHQSLISRLQTELSNLDSELTARSVLISFYPHPRHILAKDSETKEKYSKLITPLRARNYILKDLGISDHVALRFSEKLAAVQPENFIKKIVQTFNPKIVVVGFDWCFGKNRTGNIDLLKSLGKSLDFKTIVVDKVVNADYEKIGSSKVRALIDSANLKSLSEILGRKFSVFGKVVRGDGRGQRLGFRTANIHCYGQLLPALGVYKTAVRIDGRSYKSITNVGTRPTFTGNSVKPVVEAHVLDFKRDIYNMEIEVAFDDYVRPEMRFNSKEELISQIKKDISSLD